LRAIQEVGMSQAYIKLGMKKCISIESIITGSIFQNKIIWDLMPTPIPEIPQEEKVLIEQEIAQHIIEQFQPLLSQISILPPEEQLMAQQRINSLITEKMQNMKEQVENAINDKAMEKAERVSKQIYDEFIEGDVYHEIMNFIKYYVRYSFAVMKFPVYKRAKKRKYLEGYVPVVVDEIIQTAEAVNPFDIYFTEDTRDLKTGELFQRHKIHKIELQELIGMKGYDEKAIRHILQKRPKGYQNIETTGELERKQLEKTTHDSTLKQLGMYDVLEFWGIVDGKDLLDWGYDDKDDEIDSDKAYRINAWIIDNIIIKAVLTPDIFGNNPYFFDCYISEPDNVVGLGIMDIIDDVEHAFNANIRAILNNAGFASGPISLINKQFIPIKKETGKPVIHPYQVIVTDQYVTDGSKPIQFFQSDLVADRLINVAAFIQSIGDEVTIPKQSYGEGGGQTETASGISMLQQAANILIEYAIVRIYENIIYPMVLSKYHYILTYDPDESKKGDLNIAPIQYKDLIRNAQKISRLNEFLQTTSNPMDIQITGIDGRYNLLKEMVKILGFDADKVIPHRPPKEMPTAQTGQGITSKGSPQQLDLSGEQQGGVNINQFQNQRK
jgi:hypothetical protein